MNRKNQIEREREETNRELGIRVILKLNFEKHLTYIRPNKNERGNSLELSFKKTNFKKECAEVLKYNFKTSSLSSTILLIEELTFVGEECDDYSSTSYYIYGLGAPRSHTGAVARLRRRAGRADEGR